MKEYFSHDYNTRTDEKIIKLLFKENWEGYGLYWAIVELIYIGNGEIREDYDLLAHEMRTQCQRIKRIVSDYGLFYSKDGLIRSESIDRRIQERAERSNIARGSAMKRWDNAKAMPMQCQRNAIKGKERKGKERKEEEITTTESALADRLVNWDNCKTNLQRFMAYYISREMPEVYKRGTQPQALALFKRFGRAASELLTVAGDLPTAKRIFDLSMAHYNKKGLSWNLSTVAANAGEFLNIALQERKPV